MADNTTGKVGQINVEIGANTAPLKAGLKEAEAATKQTAQNMRADAGQAATAFESASAGARSMADNIKASTASWKALSSAIGSIIGIVGRVTFLVGALTAAIVGAAKVASELWSWLVKVGESAEVAGFKVADPLIKQLDRLKSIKPVTLINTVQLEEDVKKLDELEERIAKLQAEQQAQKQNRFGGGFPVDRELNKAIEDRERILNQLHRIQKEIDRADEEAARKRAADLAARAESDAARVLRKIREEERKAHEERMNEAAALRLYNLETWRMVDEENEKRAKERIRNQIRNFRQLEDAFRGLAQAQRGVFDANKFAIDINRLANAIDDLAKSPRGAMVIGQAY